MCWFLCYEGQMDRTFIVGDIHGDIDALETLMSRLPELDIGDTLVFLGDYLDRGPASAEVVEAIRVRIPEQVDAKVVALRGNHEDAWLQVIDEGWPGFVLPPNNGCRQCLRSFRPEIEPREENILLLTGSFFPADVVQWMRSLPYFYEDSQGIYVHAGLSRIDGRWPHPSEVENLRELLWIRSQDFFANYDGKTIVVGHTVTRTLPPDLDKFTPEDPDDMFWAGKGAYAIDTGAGKGGFLTALELPAGNVYESR